uniref:Uncharacterized protein LOC111116555 n=1 Tax=Crassostrea virginica TaxID=6565 RepID=A0A8B8C918_CRAVI|nr:uncharacterized protein LOC111116555 [Crassostrea virginica]
MKPRRISILDVKSAWESIKNEVKVTPTMVFSVIGDSNSFVPCPWAKTVFETALIEAAKSGGESWILYSGNEQGVSKSVRDAYRKYGNKEFGTKNDKIPKDDKNRHIKLISITNKKREVKDMETVVRCSCKNGEVDKFLLEFEKFVSEQEVSFFSQRVDFRMPVPIAIIVCEGDIDTIAHTAGALQNKLPVVIIKGSGKAADLILNYIERSHLLRKNAGVLFGIKFEESNFQTLKGYLRIIRKNRDLVGVFDLDVDDPLKLSNIVGEAVVSCWSMANILPTETKDVEEEESDINQNTGNSSEQKTTTEDAYADRASLTWSSITWKLLSKNSISPEEDTIHELLEGYKKESRPGVLNPKFTSPTSLPLYFYFGYQLLQESDLLQKCGHILLLEALKANRCDYVRVLLDQGVRLKSENLPELYKQTVSCKECRFDKDDCLHMQWILKQILETEAKTLCHQHSFAMDSIQEKAEHERDVKKILERSVADSAKRLCCKILRYEGTKMRKTNAEAEETCDTSDILLWALFANRKELAEIFWIKGEDHLLAGLVCSVLLQKLSKKAQNVKEQSLCMDLAEHAKLFEQRCIRIMDEMYKEDTIHGAEAMDDEAEIWGVQSSPLAIAYENVMYDVVAHVCSRKNMNKQWYNNLAPDLKPFCKAAFQRPRKFLTAPLTKYMINYIMFFTVLIMYSAFVLTSIHTDYYVQGIGRIFEYYVYFWAFGDFIEELISCFGILGSNSRFLRGNYRRLKKYMYDFWNAVDLLSYVLLIIALFVRHFYQSTTFTIARRMFSLSVLVMYLRFLEVFLIHRRLGPTLIMIKEMLKDLMNFLFIAVFMILGVGIYYHANLFPDYQEFWSGGVTNWRIWEVLYYPYWQIYADINLDFLNAEEDEPKCANNTYNPCPQKDWTVPIVAGGYLLFAHLLLVNLVIAMFSYTFERVQKNSEKLWWYERYTAISDYQWRIPSPLNLLFIPYRIYSACKRKSRCSKKGLETASSAYEQEDSKDMDAKAIADMKNVWEEVKDGVNSTPTMVFSVIGDSDSFVPRPWPKTVFQTALIEAAKSGGETWVLYSGKEQGVSKAVRDAYSKYGNKEFGTRNVDIHKDNTDRHVKLISITDKEIRDRKLETVVHCTAENGGIDSFRIEFEKFVSGQEVSFFNQKVDLRMPVPIAIIVCEGDIGTIAHTAAALKNKLPVIIMKGSGKAADLTLDYLENSSDLRKNVGIVFGMTFEDAPFQTLEGYLKIIASNKDFVGVFDLNNDDPLKLSGIVGETVVRCWSMEKIHTIHPKGAGKETSQLPQESTQDKGSLDQAPANITGSTITWRLLRKNSIKPEEKTIHEFLEEYQKEPRPGILNPKFTSPTSLPLYFYFGYQLLQESDLLQKCGHVLLLEALKANRCDYVRVLLDQGVELKTKNLPELYEKTVSCKECHFKKDDCLHMQWILKQILNTEAKTLCHQYRHAMEKIGKDKSKRDKYLKKIKELETSVAKSAKKLCCKILQFEGVKEKKEDIRNDKILDSCETSDILLWAIFANRKEIAEICWIRGEDHLVAGLCCSVLLQKLSKKARNIEEYRLSTDLEDHARLFEQRCLSIMDEMFNEDAKHAVEAMDDEANIWGVKSSPLAIAYENFMYDVVAHTCSRKNMNKQWYNNLAPDFKPFCKSAFQKPRQFITAPLTRYILNYTMFFAMLVVYSAFVLTSIYENFETVGEFLEIYVYAWAFGDFVEELISCFGYIGSHSRFHRGLYKRLKRYLYDFWNAIDLLSYLLLIIALFVRHLPYAIEHNIARRTFSLSLLVMYVRFLEVFLVNRNLGPTLIMVKEMLKDLLHFMLIVVFLVIGVGIYYQANLYPDYQHFWSGDWKEWRIWEVLYYPYWQIYSDFNLDYLHGNCNATIPQEIETTRDSCAQSDWSVIVVAGGYALFMDLLLVNLVIAMFSYTFERVQQNSEKLWWYERYTAIHDYRWRIPSPFNLLFLPFRLVNMCIRRSRCSNRDIEEANVTVDQRDRKDYNAKEYRRELQKITASGIYNKI